MPGKQGTVYTDGKGASTGGKAGYGVHIGQGHPQNASGPVRGAQTGERAEFKAADRGLTQAAKAGYSHVNLVTDSATVANAGRTGNYSGPNQDLHHSIQGKAADMGSVNYQAVHGHSGNPGNQAAHAAANAGSKK